MTQLSESLITDQHILTRRKVLTAFSMAGLSMVSAPAFADKTAQKRKVSGFFFFENISEMKGHSSLKEGDALKTAGYYKAGDGGAAEYLVSRINEKPNEGEFIELKNGLVAMLIHTGFVNYQMFGAKGDQDNDDGIQIKAAHSYANKASIPVINYSGEYWIKKTTNIEIQTNVEWGHTVFHIDERYNTKNSRFRILSRHASIPVQFTPEEKSQFLSKFGPGLSILPELAPYKNSLMILIDNNDRIGFRAGKAYGGKVSQRRQEIFYVEEHGRIIGDIAWKFKDYTSFIAYPAENNYLTIEGGTFYLSGDNSEMKIKGYLTNGFQILRSRTIIRNQWVGLENGKADVSMVQRSGFYNFSRVYDVVLENVRLMPWEKDRVDKTKKVPQGTYGIGGGHMFNVVFRNVTAEGSMVHWGVFGTNINKNFRIEHCKLNRIDVHFHCWNLTISNSEIGFKSVTVTGGGDLCVENTIIHSNLFISFRKDYGGKWDGNINIRNCKLIPITTRSTALLSFLADDFNYHYPIGYAHKIKIEDFIIDYKSAPSEKSLCRLIQNATFSTTQEAGRLFFPYEAEFKNISVEGRENGIRLMHIPNPIGFKMQKKGSYDSVELITNSRMVFENIQLETIDNPTEQKAHIIFNKPNGEKDESSLLPEIQFKDCHNLTAYFGGNAMDLSFNNCTINNLYLSEVGKLPGNISFNKCKFKPILSAEKSTYLLSSELGTTFTNCTLYAPQVNNKSRPDLLSLIDFVQINKTVKYNHLNTRLGNDILNYCKSKGITLVPKFIDMLKSHHELESDNI